MSVGVMHTSGDLNSRRPSTWIVTYVPVRPRGGPSGVQARSAMEHGCPFPLVQESSYRPPTTLDLISIAVSSGKNSGGKIEKSPLTLKSFIFMSLAGACKPSEGIFEAIVVLLS